jgi:MFS family permease
LAGFGVCGAFVVVLYAQVRMLFPEHLTGRAVAALNLFAEGGAACVQWGIGLLIGLFLVTGAGHYPPEAYRVAFLVTAVLSLLALLFYLPMLGANARGKR